jgi:tetratricopeptide (TPR) repeat protein
MQAKVRLDSWKSIADYLERSPRTVQRWHATHGLPVHHFGGSKSSVFAYGEDLDRWLMSRAGETGSTEAGEDEELEARRKRSIELTAQAQEMWETRSEENLEAIAGLCRRAIDQYPGNARAFIGLANAMILAALQGVMDSSVAYPCAMQALRRTAQLDTKDVEARCSAAWLDMVYERKWRQARTGFEEVLSRQPQNTFAISGLSLLLIAEGNVGDACYCAWEAWKQNTLICSLGNLVCWAHYLAGEYEQALELIAQVRGSGGNGATLGAIEALGLLQAAPLAASLGRLETLANRFPENPTLQGALGYACARLGETGKAERIFQKLDQMSQLKKRNGGYGLALVLLGLGKRQEAVEWLEAAFAEGALWSLGFGSDPILRMLGGFPRFESLLRKAGPPAADGLPTASSLPSKA